MCVCVMFRVKEVKSVLFDLKNIFKNITNNKQERNITRTIKTFWNSHTV